MVKVATTTRAKAPATLRAPPRPATPERRPKANSAQHSDAQAKTPTNCTWKAQTKFSPCCRENSRATATAPSATRAAGPAPARTASQTNSAACSACVARMTALSSSPEPPKTR